MSAPLPPPSPLWEALYATAYVWALGKHESPASASVVAASIATQGEVARHRHAARIDQARARGDAGDGPQMRSARSPDGPGELPPPPPSPPAPSSPSMSPGAVTPFLVLVCGGRTFADVLLVRGVLDAYLRVKGRGLGVLHGGADGADRLAHLWAHRAGLTTLRVDADWETHGKAAGPIRNQKMVDMRPEYVVAFPGGAGTRDLVTRATHAGLAVQTIVPKDVRANGFFPLDFAQLRDTPFLKGLPETSS